MESDTPKGPQYRGSEITGYFTVSYRIHVKLSLVEINEQKIIRLGVRASRNILESLPPLVCDEVSKSLHMEFHLQEGRGAGHAPSDFRSTSHGYEFHRIPGFRLKPAQQEW